MTLRNEESESEYRQPTRRETDTAEPQTAPLPELNQRTTTTRYSAQSSQNSVPATNRFIEAFLLMLAVGVATFVTQLIWVAMVPVVSNYAFLISTATFWFGVISFVGSVLTAVVIGIGTGALANRQSMIGTLITANGIVFVFWRVVQFFALPQQYRGNWQFTFISLVQGVLGLVTVTVAEILIARLVASRNRIPGR